MRQGTGKKTERWVGREKMGEYLFARNEPWTVRQGTREEVRVLCVALETSGLGPGLTGLAQRPAGPTASWQLKSASSHVRSGERSR